MVQNFLLRISWKTIGLIITGLALSIFVLFTNFSRVQDPVLTISFLDVGQGDAIYIRTPAGNELLIDGGPDDSVLHQLRTVMKPGDRHIDMIFVTHPDKDHIAGLSYVFDDYTIGHLVHSEIRSDTQFDRTLHAKISQEKNLVTHIARRGMRIILDDHYGVFLDILFPDQDTTNFKDTNDASIVTRLVYDEIQIIFTGDAPASVEQFLVRQNQKILPSQVLQLGHHGSKTSSSDVFLQAVAPDIAVASAGKNNRYGHPATEVVDRVTKNNITLLTTKELGTITFTSDGKTIWRE